MVAGMCGSGPISKSIEREGQGTVLRRRITEAVEMSLSVRIETRRIREFLLGPLNEECGKNIGTPPCSSEFGRLIEIVENTISNIQVTQENIAAIARELPL